MQTMTEILKSRAACNPSPEVRVSWAAQLGAVAGAEVMSESLCAEGGVLYALARKNGEKVVVRFAASGDGASAKVDDTAGVVQVLPCSVETAVSLRKETKFLCPRVGELRTSAGLGDRLGLATPGHLRAVRGTGLFPVLSQQSIREMERTRRTPDDVMSCAIFGALESGWVEGFGSDADHLKLPEYVDYTMQAGFTMFTIDPGDHVDNNADTMDAGALAGAFEALPWSRMETSAADTRARFAGKSVDADLSESVFEEQKLLRAAIKYGRAIAHTAAMARHIVLVAGGREVEIEVSVDETDSPTSALEHYYIASELKRMGIKWVSLAPRFVGRFEKGVDYIGDLAEFEAKYIEHCRVAEALGPYKMSIHSGSDKFSIYEICARYARGKVHLKTAGTSYLEALRAVARVNPELFLEILTFARERYEEDKASYHVSADLTKILTPEQVDAADPGASLDQFDTREGLHVTFGSVLTADDGKRFKPRLLETLRGNEEVHYEILRAHILRHLKPLQAGG